MVDRETFEQARLRSLVLCESGPFRLGRNDEAAEKNQNRLRGLIEGFGESVLWEGPS